MADPGVGNSSSGDDVPFMQQLLDNMWLLLIIGILSPTVLYLVWGVVDILSIPSLP